MLSFEEWKRKNAQGSQTQNPSTDTVSDQKKRMTFEEYKAYRKSPDFDPSSFSRERAAKMQQIDPEERKVYGQPQAVVENEKKFNVNQSLSEAKKEGRDSYVTIGDELKGLGLSGIQGAINTVKAVPDIIRSGGNMVSGGRFEKTAVGGAVRSTSEFFGKASDVAQGYKPKSVQKAEANPIFSGNLDEGITFENAPNASQLINTSVSSLVQLPSYLVGGKWVGGAGKLLLKIPQVAKVLSKTPALKKAVEAVEKFKEPIQQGIVNSQIIAGQTFTDTFTDAYETAVNKGYSEDESVDIATQIALDAAGEIMPVSAGTGAGLGFAMKSGGSALVRGAKGVIEEAPSESVEEFEQYGAQQGAMKQLDPSRRRVTGEALSAAAMGFVSGAGMGGAVASFNGNGSKNTNNEQTPIESEQQQAQEKSLENAGTSTTTNNKTAPTEQNISENEQQLITALVNNDKKSLKKAVERASTHELQAAETLLSNLERQGQGAEAETMRQYIQDVREDREISMEEAAKSVVNGEKDTETALKDVSNADKKRVVDFVEKVAEQDSGKSENLVKEAETIKTNREKQEVLDKVKDNLLKEKAETKEVSKKQALQNKINEIDKERKPEYASSNEKRTSEGTSVPRSKKVSGSKTVGAGGRSGVASSDTQRSVEEKQRDAGAKRDNARTGDDGRQRVNTIGELRERAKTDPNAKHVLDLWMENKGPLFPLIEAYNRSLQSEKNSQKNNSESKGGVQKKYSQKDIEKLAASKKDFTDEEKEILSQYEGSGGQKEGSGRGVLDEFFTPESVVKSIWDIVISNLPFDAAIDESQELNVLEPSAGSGRFLKFAPTNSNITAYETSKTSAKILKTLFPNANVQNLPFEDMFMDKKGKKKAYEKKFDVVVGNPPYGKHRGMYKGLGEEKSIGTYEAYFIKRSLDVTKQNGTVAMIVPSGFLRGSLNSSKTAISLRGDLIAAYRMPNGIFDNTDVGTDIVVFRAFDHLSDKTGAKPDVETIINDNYFKQNPDHILGNETTRKGRFGEEYAVEGNLKDALEKMSDLKYKIDPVKEAEIEEEQSFPNVPEKGKYKKGDSVRYIDKKGQELTGTVKWVDENTATINVDQIMEAGGIPIGRIEIVPFDRLEPYDYEKAEIQNQAAEEVKAKVKKTKKESRTKKQEAKDNSGVMVRDEKKPYFLRSVKKDKKKVFTQSFEPSDIEMLIADNTREDGSVNTENVNKSDLNFYNGKYYGDFNYYQGDIYQKLEQLEKDRGNMSAEQYKKQKSGLEAILPEPMTIKDITLLPNERFSKDFSVSFNGESMSLASAFKNWIQTLPYEALHGLSQWDLRGYVDGSVVNTGDKKRNQELRKKRRDVGNALFKKFYRSELSEDEKKKVVDQFNRTFNGTHRPDYTKYPISPELNTKFYGVDLKLRDIQMEGAAFLTNKGVGLLAYDVGVGKTLAAITALSEVMRRGWAKRPLIVVPKNLKTKWIEDVMQAMPGAKINDLANLGGEFKGDSEIKIEDGTISIITEDGFKRIGYNDETFDRLTRDLQDTTFTLGDKSKRSKEIEGAKAEETAGMARRGTDFPRTFESLGFDHITFDEVHREKNVFSKAQAKSGEKKSNEYQALRGSVSERGLKAYLATQYILDKNNGRNVFLLTATPFTNSPIEIYSVMSLMAKKRLEEMGLKNVNDFISAFIDIESKFAIKANGQMLPVDQTRNFHNLQQLQKLILEYIDFRTGDEAGIPRPKKYQRTPHLKLSEKQAEYITKAQELFNDKDAGVLSAITELQKITMSPYLSKYHTGGVYSVKPKEFVENSPKIKYVVEAIKRAHKAKSDAGQIIFAEKGIESFRVLKEYFVNDLGYAPEEVEILDSSVREAKKDQIQNDFQHGKIKILMASGTVKEGIDLQRKSTDLYNIFLPWNPTDMLQIEGRTWRQGSEFANVRIHYPLVENTIDSFMFQKLEEKAARLSNVWSYKGNTIDVSEIDFEKMKFELITDPVRRAEAEKEFKTAEIKHKYETAKADVAFIERKMKKLTEAQVEYDRYKELKENAIQRDDSSSVDYYSKYESESKKKMETARKNLVKEGIKIDDIKKKSEAKRKEIKELSGKITEIETEYNKKIQETGDQSFKLATGKSDYDSILSDIGDKPFYKTMDLASFEKYNRDKLGRFATKDVFPDEIKIVSELESMKLEELERTKAAKKVKEYVNKFTDTQITPELAATLAFDLTNFILKGNRIASYDNNFVISTDNRKVSEMSEREAFGVLRHEVIHHINLLLSGTKFDEYLITWYRSLGKTRKHLIFGGKKRYERYLEKYKGYVNSRADLEYLMANEASAHALQLDPVNAPPAQRDLIQRVVEVVRRILRALIVGRSKEYQKIRDSYSRFFNPDGRVYISSQMENASFNVQLALRSKIQEGGNKYKNIILPYLSNDEETNDRYQKSGNLKLNERRAAYAAAIKEVYGDKIPPSLSKIVDENFKEVDRRTNIAASKMEAIGVRTFQTGFSEGKKVGYLSGERAAIKKNEGEIAKLNEKITKEEFKGQKEKEKLEKELEVKAEQNRDLKREMRRKMHMQAERHKRAKAALKQKLKDSMTAYKEIRKEMVSYIKENLPQKSHGKFLSAIRDGKTKKNLAKIMERVDEEIVRLQRADAVASIKKIMKTADRLPIEAQYKVLQITDGIQWTGVLRGTLEKLQRIRDYIASNPGVENTMPTRILKRLGILEKKSYKTLTTDQLLKLNAELEQIKSIGIAVRESRKINLITSLNKRLETLRETSTNFDHIKQSGITQDERDKFTLGSKLLDKGQAIWGLIPVDDMMTKFDGGNEDGANYRLIKRPIDIAHRNFQRVSIDIRKRFKKFIDENAKGLTKKNWERIGIYAIREQKGGYQKLVSSGYTESQVESITLSKEEYAIYAYMRRELDALYEPIKRVYEATTGEVFNPPVENYFPFVMDFSNARPIYDEMREMYSGIKGVKSKGFTQERVGGFNPIVMDAQEAFLHHINRATYYIAMEETLTQVRDMIQHRRYALAVGEKGQKYVMDYIAAMERGGKPAKEGNEAIHRAMNVIRNNVTLGILAFKITTPLVQIGAVANGVSKIGVGAARGALDVSISQELRDFIREASPELASRVGDDPSLSEFKPPKWVIKLGEKENVTPEQIKKVGLYGIVKLDMLAAFGTWIGAYKQYLEREGEAFDMQNVNEDASLWADKIVRQTQASSSYKDAPSALRYSVGKFILQFQTFSLFQTNYILGDIARNVKNNPGKAAWQAAFVTLNSLFYTAVTGAVLHLIWGDDDDESFGEKMVWDLAQSFAVIGNFFYFAEGVAQRGYMGAKDIKLGVPALDTMIGVFQNIGTAVTSKKKETPIIKTIEGIGTLSGVPGSSQASQAYRAILKRMEK